MVRAAPENLCPNDRIHTGSGLGGEEGKEGRRMQREKKRDEGGRLIYLWKSPTTRQPTLSSTVIIEW